MGAYKHVYFNVTSNSLSIWAGTVAAVVLLYEATRKMFVALYQGTEGGKAGLPDGGCGQGEQEEGCQRREVEKGGRAGTALPDDVGEGSVLRSGVCQM